MQIQVKCSCGGENCPEWAVIEIQGVVEVNPSFQNAIHNLLIGQLCRPSSQESYTLTIGYHELMGSKVKLKKPLLILKKVKTWDHGAETEAASSSSSNIQLDVVGVIRQKIIFKTRPKALISKPQPFVKEKAGQIPSAFSSNKPLVQEPAAK